MYAFSYWHIYYDSAFLNQPIRLSNDLYLDLKIDSTAYQWPKLRKLPQLPRAFELLQKFILHENSWADSKHQSLIDIETKLNNLLINLQCQKKYGKQFWQISTRRIQSSIVHFYFFLKMFILICIPQNSQNLLQASTNQQSVLNLVELQNFVNSIILLIKPLHSFMTQDQQLKKEVRLSHDFFNQFLKVLKEMPSLKRKHLTEIPKLMEYICLVNPEESSRTPSPENSPTIRSRMITDIDKNRRNQKDNSQQKDSFEKADHSKKIDLTKNIKKYKKQVQIDIKPQEKCVAQTLKLFKFKQRVKKPSVFEVQHSDSVGSRSRGKNSEIDRSPNKNRSPTQDKIMTLQTSRKFTKITRTDTWQERSMRESSSFFDSRPRELTSKTIQNKKGYKFIQEEEPQIERKEINKKQKKIKIQIKTVQYSQQINFTDGKSKGWGILREQFKKRLAKRRLLRLMNFQ